MTDHLKPWPYPLWVAHRGAGKLAPENTMAAFRMGAGYGYRMFECDAKLSSDGVLFLLHDATLERTTNGHGIGSELPMGALAQLDAGSWHSRAWAGETLPTLEALSRWCLANHFFLNVEIKPTPGQEEATGRATGELMQRIWPGDRVQPLFTSFKPEALKGARDTAPQIPRGLLVDKLSDATGDADLRTALALDCSAMVLNHALWDAPLVAKVHGAGLRCSSYTVNDEWAAQRLIDLGTDGIITDRVDLFSPASR
ncbi:glycerophosphodiester phosphodiesterase [Delftia sp. PS-11]|uniref:glycerophosphodiester phosphodiesterase n=1 Tax=Delftia sp. PS-11 TaxID=2767222 RepID=UPI002457610E|nr:glycerophosphodiester phosphodiesterase [Delftia sp. PS-11]KAJ8746704.1 glycerophosphodiester phosphodiesterase [Delftia sp. PS-11]